MKQCPTIGEVAYAVEQEYLHRKNLLRAAATVAHALTMQTGHPWTRTHVFQFLADGKKWWEDDTRETGK